ncbi:hypothetical protein [Iningainema tapete]|uniref:Uncharacterized protein n=1 Tax=Iningainema tapete BLCC-T55 TaxID=2748662 RepID=A0A8J7C964_9CYAN|nr:hypothetical protein [Iningainema tapete]MBD2770670.1 hypothetical protein [Iningainema tapete BLCC-T55]
MKRVQRLARLEKSKMFTQKQAKDLSGFTRSQLLTWEEAGIIMPDRQYAILYTWNQLILLRILRHLRNRWTFQQIIKGFKNSRRPIDEILQILPKAVLCNFGEFGKYPDIEIEIQVHDLCNAENDIQEKIFRNVCHKAFPLIDEAGRQTQISVPKIIDEIKVLAEQNKIENFDVKVG